LTIIEDVRGRWGGDDGVDGEIWTFGEKDPSAIEKSLERKDVITTGCWASSTNPALADPRVIPEKNI
jgi:hypothetical protein